MTLRLWFDLATVLHLAETTISTRQRVDVDGDVDPHAPPALHLMRDYSDDLHDRLYIDANFYPSLSGYSLFAEPFRSTTSGRRYAYGITWSEWLGNTPRGHHPIQARIALLDDTRLIDLLRAGYAAGFDAFTIDADTDAVLRPGIARRRVRRSRRVPQAGVSHQARLPQEPPYTSFTATNP